MRVLLTNDDGIRADGIQALRQALAALPGVELFVIAPEANQSATARSITTRRPIWVEELDFGDGSVGYAIDGTPVDCVRFAALGLIDGFAPDLVVSGINHGFNLGDDITYSGTVAAAFEGVLLGVPGVAISQQSVAREMDFRLGRSFDFSTAASFAARLVDEIEDVPLPAGTLLNVNVPAGDVAGVQVARLGKRIYRDELSVVEEGSTPGRRLYRVYGDTPDYRREHGTDLAAIADGCIAVTPLHFDLTDREAIETLRSYDLDALLRPAAGGIGS